MVEDASKVLSELITDFPDVLCFTACFSCRKASVLRRVTNLNDFPGGKTSKQLVGQVGCSHVCVQSLLLGRMGQEGLVHVWFKSSFSNLVRSWFKSHNTG